MSTPEPTRTHTFRTLPARIVGAVIVTGALVAVVISLVDSRTRGLDLVYPLLIAGIVAGLMWMLLLRPSVEVWSDRVVLRNVFRDTTVPFAHVQSFSHEWAFEVTDTTGHRHNSWAIPRERQLTPRRAREDFADTTVRGRSKPGMTATLVVDHAEKARSAWSIADKQQTPDQPAVTAQWAWTSLVPVALLVVALAVVLILN
ncbi:hypothetical protein K0651_11720 [Ornithinimicrobium sp. Arc0846-15]|nr:hypothetical protein [Ornithinimicrobium laminariae]